MENLVAILCSGQGGQHPEMFDLVAEAPEAEPVFAAATEVLGQDPRRFVHASEPAALFSDRCGQILCCTRALAVWAALGNARPTRAVIAGYSLGELASWGCSGIFDAATTLQLAARRADVMDAAAPKDAGLAGILGLTRPALDALLSGREAHVAIINGVDSFVIGGYRSALEDICRDATAHGARHVVMLPVHVPSHTPLMAKASPRLAEILAKASPKMPHPGYRVLTGIDGDTVWDVEDAITKLARQISSTIHWSDCLDSCRAAGAQTALELGPGRALAKMAADRFPEGAARSAEDFKTLPGLRSWLQRAYGA